VGGWGQPTTRDPEDRTAGQDKSRVGTKGETPLKKEGKRRGQGFKTTGVRPITEKKANNPDGENSAVAKAWREKFGRTRSRGIWGISRTTPQSKIGNNTSE